MKAALLAIAGCLWCAGAARAQDDAAAFDLAYKTRAIGELRRLRDDSVFARGLQLTGFGRDRGRLEGEARGRAGPLNVLLTGTAEGEQGRGTRSTLLANEAYADFGAGANRFSAGKKILSAGIGYGFRPLDVIQRESRLQLLPPALEGIPHLAWEHFAADSAWSLVYANPGHGRRDAPRDDGSLSLRHFRRTGSADWHAAARISARMRTEIGAAVSAVPHASLELHGALLVQLRGERLVPPAQPASPVDLLAPEQALVTERVASARKALAGFTWTHDSGWSLLGELWRDDTAPSAADWQRLAAQAAQRNALAALPGVSPAAIEGSQAAATRMFQQPGLSRRAGLGRVAWTDPAGGGWSASLDLLRSFDDASYSITAAAGWAADRLRVDAGLRYYGGKPDAVFRLLPERSILYVGLSLAL